MPSAATKDAVTQGHIRSLASLVPLPHGGDSTANMFVMELLPQHLHVQAAGADALCSH